MTNNLKNYLKIGSLLVGVSLLLWNCEQESDIDIEPQNSTYNVAHKNFDFIAQNKSLLNKVGFLSKKKNNLASRENNTNDFTIFTDKLTYITPTDGSRESYSFYIERNSRAQTNQIENLILSKDSGEDQYRAHIITYFFPDGLHGEHDNFEITGFEEIDAESVSELYAKSSGCENTYEYVAIETEHDCYSGNHSGADEAESCDGQGTLPYSTWGIHVVVHYQCDGGGMGGDGLGRGGGETEVPGGGGGTPGDNTLPVDAGITLPPTCQTNDCDGEIVANQINELLDSTLSYNDLLWLNDNAMEADTIINFLNENSNSQDAKEFAIKAIEALMNGGEVDYPNKVILDSSFVNNVKLKCVYDKLTSDNSPLFKNTVGAFVNDPKFNLTFKVGDCITTNDACTNDTNPENIIITIEDINTNPIELAQLILHEAIHAELARFVAQYLSGVDVNNRPQLFQYYEYYEALYGGYSGDIDHIYMTVNYINPIASALRDFDNNSYPLDHYKSFAWDGLRAWETEGLMEPFEDIYNDYRPIVIQNTSVCN